MGASAVGTWLGLFDRMLNFVLLSAVMRSWVERSLNVVLEWNLNER